MFFTRSSTGARVWSARMAEIAQFARSGPRAGQAIRQRHALELAIDGIALAHPNPRVGAIVVRGHQKVGEGFHVYDHRDHAEIVALKQAKSMRLVTAALGGKGGGDLAGLADHLLVVPSDTTARIQEMHILLGQMLCGALEIELGLA